MFDIAWSEMVLIGAVALIAIGPKDLRKAAEFQDHFREAMREAELESVRQDVASINQNLTSVASGINQELSSVTSGLPTAAPVAASASEPAPDSVPMPSPGTSISVEPTQGGVVITETATDTAPAGQMAGTATEAQAAAKPARKPRRKPTAKVGETALTVDATAEAAPATMATSADAVSAPSKPKPVRKRASKAQPSGDDQAA